MEVIVSVRDQYNTYIARAEGKSASYTGGERGAVERLAVKIFGEGQRVAINKTARKDGERISYWRITTDIAQALNPRDGMTVELEDHGQDFLELDIKDGRIVETRPFQGWVWNGCAVLNEVLAVGDLIDIQRDADHPRFIKYPVAAVRPLAQQEG
jgi:hypothetical protein